MTRIIFTDRLILRPFDEKDAEDVFEWVGDPVVNRYMPYPVYEDIEQVKKRLEQAKNKDYESGFALKETGKVIITDCIWIDGFRFISRNTFVKRRNKKLSCDSGKEGK